MEQTAWWASKTLWVNALTLVVVLIDQLMSANLLGPTALSILAIVNMLLRSFLTKGPIVASTTQPSSLTKD